MAVDLHNLPPWTVPAMRRAVNRVFGVGRDIDMTEDIVQDVLLKALEEPNVFSAPGQLVVAARNKAYYHFRELGRGYSTSLECLDEREEPFSEESTRVVENKGDIERLLGILPTPLAEVVVLYYIFGFTMREVARMQRCSFENIRLRIDKAVGHMRGWAIGDIR